MPDRPILIFPAATVAARQKAGGGFPGGPGPRPTREEQARRLAARFAALEPVFGVAQPGLEGVDPEQVLVLETIGSVEEFQNVVKRIQGLEWLGDFDAEVAAGDPGFLADGAGPEDLPARIFVLAGNRTAYNEVLALWRQWTTAANEKLPYGYGKLAEAFKYLNDVRPWGPKDRVFATGVVAYWERQLATNDPTIRFEIELWCRGLAEKREAAYARLQAVVTEAGGQCVKQAAIPEVDYHGVLVDVPAPRVREAVQAINAGADTRLLRLSDIKYFAPIGHASLALVGEAAESAHQDLPRPVGDPIVAILDGLPLANHAALDGRLVIDDPDDLARVYQAGEHRHGTAMASLVIRDEYESSEASLSNPVYVRPVMAPGRPDVNGTRWETFPASELPVDLVHRAIRRMFDADGGTPAKAPHVKVINLSLGDAAQPFDRHLSPWARLLDWLSWKYRVLFVVSAGNHLIDLTIPIPQAGIPGLSDVELQAHTLRAMSLQKVRRSLLAPAESINALTVGAGHGQTAPNGAVGTFVDLMRGGALPSPVSPVASGFRRAIKPDILVRGGRRHYAPKILQGTPARTEFEIRNAVAQPGQLVAACHPAGTSNRFTTRVCGSSNSTALTTRAAALMLQRLKDLRTELGGAVVTDAMLSVIVKAMLAHGASWGDWFAFFNQVFQGPDNGMERWRRIKRACSQFLGYGFADFERGTVCTDQRVVLLGCGNLKGEEGHIYNVPLPSALSAQTVKRRLTITLAWFTPINPRHRNYRVADLWFDPPTDYLRVKRTDAEHDGVTRGTLQHEVLEGVDAVPISDDTLMPIQVNCRPDAASKVPLGIPYALMVSLETATPLAVSIYAQVKVKIDALHVPVGVRVPGVIPGR